MKDQVAASTVAFASLKREGFVPSGDLVLIVVADEEVGGVRGHEGYGLRWLVEAHPEAARCDYAINEGGGERLVLGGTPVYLCATAEKMSAPFTLRVHGRSGHASMPGIADNALVKAARYVEALGAYEPEPELIPEARGFLEAVLGETPPVEEALLRASELHPSLPALVQPLLALTLSPTMIDASHQANVIPALCEVTVDCRLLPEQTPADAEPLIRAALGDGDYELEWISATGGTRSNLATPLWDALESFVAGIEPGARMAPVACAGFTDSHYLPGGLRHGRVRLLPDQGDGRGGGDEARALRERAHRSGRPRARRRDAARDRADTARGDERRRHAASKLPLVGEPAGGSLG